MDQKHAYKRNLSTRARSSGRRRVACAAAAATAAAPEDSMLDSFVLGETEGGSGQVVAAGAAGRHLLLAMRLDSRSHRSASGAEGALASLSSPC